MIAQVVEQNVKSMTKDKRSDTTVQKVRQINKQYKEVLDKEGSVLDTASKEILRVLDARADLFHQVVAQCNAALTDLNMLRVKTAVLRHDSTLCRQNMEKI